MLHELLPEAYQRPPLPQVLPQSRRGDAYDTLRRIAADFFESTRHACENGDYTRDWYGTPRPTRMPVDVSYAIVTGEAARMADELSDMYAEPGQAMWPEIQYGLTALLAYHLVTSEVDPAAALVQSAKLRAATRLAGLLNATEQ
ncbi:hypothetical protein [Nocardia sp. NRRL S-836]|uniref:hypothetical protein n=1 Tax=Nocardia sp. NRRL S-836 TaxID=1519492 RepID=UPI0006AE9858|nr:hypothetical protein [Nocardia sp. NRRL S-836]KOV84783.1 hypothetical protein ADL03_16090 [Nocardia sp. NRRL S-836]